jgi:hypothetical protein
MDYQNKILFSNNIKQFKFLTENRPVYFEVKGNWSRYMTWRRLGEEEV